MNPSRSLILAATFIFASGLALADEATDARVRNVEVRKIVLGHGDAADATKTGVFVKRVQVDGDEPNTFLQVIGSDAEAIELDDLVDGETRSFELGDGEWMDISRVGEMLRLNIDGKEIEIPLNPAANMTLPGLAGLGQGHVEVMMLEGDDLHEHAGGPHGMVVISDDASLQHLSGSGENNWTEDSGMNFSGMNKVIVKRLHDGAGDEDVQVMALPGFAWQEAGALANLDELDSLKDADPAVKAKVLEALREILGKQHAVQLHVDVDVDSDHVDEDGNIVRVRRVVEPKRVEVR